MMMFPFVLERDVGEEESPIIHPLYPVCFVMGLLAWSEDGNRTEVGGRIMMI
jgi:hypothetical protein